MRYVLCLLLLAGCFGQLDANGRPSVIPKLSALPKEPEKRDAVLDQSGATTGPENGKGLTKKERKAVTAAAIVAAVIGSIVSRSSNVMLGMQATVDEDRHVGKPKHRRTNDGDDAAGSGHGSSALPADTESGQLVPWVDLHR